jgi:hypothetical protein
VCVRACMYMCVCVCMHACMYVCACVDVCMCVRRHVRMYVRVCVCTCVCMHVCMRAYICVCVHVRMYARTHACVMYVCIYLENVYAYLHQTWHDFSTISGREDGGGGQDSEKAVLSSFPCECDSCSCETKHDIGTTPRPKSFVSKRSLQKQRPKPRKAVLDSIPAEDVSCSSENAQDWRTTPRRILLCVLCTKCMVGTHYGLVVSVCPSVCPSDRPTVRLSVVCPYDSTW